MATKTKQSTASGRTFGNRTKLEWLIVLLLLVIIWLLLGLAFKWWPWNMNAVQLGSAFDNTSQSATKDSDKDSDGKSSSGSNGSNGTNGSNGSDGKDGSSGSTPAPSSSSALLTFAADVNRGDSKEKISVSAKQLDENCNVIVKTTSLGKQEVCTYTSGDKIVTVTYLNDKVISASRSGF